MPKLVGNPAYYLGTYKIKKRGGRGFTESVYLAGTTYDQAIAKFEPYLSWRAAILAFDCAIGRASVSDSNSLRESDIPREYRSVPILVGAETAVEPVNKINDCWNVRLEDAVGQGITKQIRALRDGWINDDDVLSTFLGITLPAAGTYGLPATPLTALNAVKGFLAACRDYTIGIQQTVTPPVPPATAPTVTNITLTWTDVVIIGTGTRDTGRDPTATKGRINRQLV